jgi:AraC family transcriptional regulator
MKQLATAMSERSPPRPSEKAFRQRRCGRAPIPVEPNIASARNLLHKETQLGEGCGMSHDENVSRQLNLSAAQVQLVNFRWSDVSQYSRRYDSHLLVRRIIPSASRVRVAVAGCNYRFPSKTLFLPAHATIDVIRDENFAEEQTVRCIIDPKWFEATVAGRLEWTDDRLPIGLNLVGDRIERAMIWIADELVAPTKSTEHTIELLLQIIINEIYDSATAAPDLKCSRFSSGILSKCKQHAIKNYVKDNLSDSIAVARLAQHCSMSESHLSRLFRQTYGLSVYKYVELQRVRRARELLANTDLMLKQIAHEVGLSCASSFCSAFKRATGETPIGYRARARRQ